MDPYLEVLTRCLVDVWSPDNGVTMNPGREWHRTSDLRLCTDHRFRDLSRRLIDDRVVVRLEADSDPMLVSHVPTVPVL